MLYFYWHFIFVNINRGEFSYIFKQSTPKSDICAIDDIKQLFSPESFWNPPTIRSPRLPADEHEIVLHTDGTWEPLPHRLEAVSPADLKKDVDTLSVEDEDDDPSEEVIITLDSEDEDVPEETTLPPKKRARLAEDSSPEIICLDDDDDDDDGND